MSEVIDLAARRVTTACRLSDVRLHQARALSAVQRVIKELGPYVDITVVRRLQQAATATNAVLRGDT